jgi:IPT/TIG domain/FG-GAP repeat
MEFGPKSPLNATDRSTAGVLTRQRSTLQPARWRRLVYAGVLAALAVAAIGRAPLDNLIGPGSPAHSVAGRALAPAVVARLPLSAQAQVSGQLAADRPLLQAAAVPGGFAIVNPAQRLSARFDRTGASVLAGGGASLRVHFSLRALTGEGARRTPGVAPTASANRVSYARPQVREWYRNGPLGLEQGFDVPRAPAGQRTDRLALTMALSGNARATLSRAAQLITLRHGSTLLSYGALVATDAAGRTLPSRLALAPGKLQILVDAAHARYPITIDPLLQQGEKKLTSGETGDEARFGSSAALSADGSTLLIGGPTDGGSRGAAWVFERSGASWEQQGAKWTGESKSEAEVDECAEEAAEETGECAFGASVALSADGNTALVGDPSSTSTAGVAWVFTRKGTEWEKTELLKGAPEAGEGRFGKSVALSADGDLALIGDSSANGERGSAWVFARSSGSAWEPQATLSVSEASRFAHFGRSVALSADGATALIGGPGDSSYAGAAWIFTRTGSSWHPGPVKLSGQGEVGKGHFGKSVALSGDGDTALIGGRDDNGGQGAVWTFTRSGASFAQQGEKLSGTPEGSALFGYSLALSGDGSIALVGAPHEEAALGSVTEFTRSGSAWSAISPALGGADAVGRGWTGASVALSSDGEVAAIGAPRDAHWEGAAWVFSFVAPAAVPQPAVTGVSPGRGSTAGGLEVKIKGRYFTKKDGLEPVVMFGSTSAASVHLRTAAEITAITPPAGAGIVDVTVQTTTGTSPTSEEDRFKFEAPGEKEAGGKSKTSGGTGTSTSGADSASGGVLGSTTTAGAACRVSLRSKHVVVALHKRAAIRLLRTGTGQCRGKVTLRYRQKGKGKRFKLRTIGSVGFSIAPGKSQVVSIKLNKLGSSLFVAGHGKLNASVAVLRTMPAPSVAKTASVRLSVKKKPKARSVHK